MTSSTPTPNSPKSLLAYLTSRTTVDCDTLDPDVASMYGPVVFEDCTSNQAIALKELEQHRHGALVQRSIDLARELKAGYDGLSTAELAVEIAMVSLARRMADHIRGFVHVQTNPFYAYSTIKTVENARRIVQLFKHVDPGFATSRVCIKVPATWEGLQACRELQATGITTLATTVFTMAQAAVAGKAGCRYIAPYLNELRVQIEKGYKGAPPLLDLCVLAQRYYTQHGLTTRVLPASLTSVNEIMQLAGVRHITLPPKLLAELAATQINPDNEEFPPSLFDDGNKETTTTTKHIVPPSKVEVADNDEEAFRMAMTRDRKGASEGMLIQAINIFCDVQLEMQAMMRVFGAV